jgi:hypothetical protein
VNHDVRAAGDRIEELLGTLRSESTRDTAEELVRLLMALYGEGLARVLAILRDHDPVLIARIAEDDLLEDLLLLHDLHPVDTSARVRQVLDGLGSLGPLEHLGIDAGGVVRVRLTASGCQRSAAVRTIEQAVLDAVPEATGVEVVTAAPATFLQIGMRPPPGWRLEVAS